MYFLKHFIHKVIQVCQWLPVIWNDEDYDFEYLLILMQYKLKRMKASMGNNRIIEHQELKNIIIEINKCISVIDEYKNAREIYEEYYEKCPVSIGYRSEPSKQTNGCTTMVSINLSTGKKLTEKENQLYCKWVRNFYNFEQKKWEEIWDRLKENVQKFWD